MSESLSQALSSAQTWALLFVLAFYITTKDRQMVILSGGLFVLSLAGDLVYSYLYNHKDAVYLWYMAWGGRALLIIILSLYVATRFKSKVVICYSVAIFAFISLSLNMARMIERNFTNTDFFKPIYMSGENAAELMIIISILPIMELVKFAKMKYKDKLKGG